MNFPNRPVFTTIGLAAFLAFLIGRQFLLRNNFDRAVRQLLEVLRVLTGRIVLVARDRPETCRCVPI